MVVPFYVQLALQASVDAAGFRYKVTVTNPRPERKKARPSRS